MISVDRAADLAQILPVFMLSGTLALKVHPSFRQEPPLARRTMRVSAMWLALLAVVGEAALINALIYDRPLGAFWAAVVGGAMSAGLAITVAPFLYDVWKATTPERRPTSVRSAPSADTPD